MRQAAVVYGFGVFYSSACLHESGAVQFMGAHADLTYRAKAREPVAQSINATSFMPHLLHKHAHYTKRSNLKARPN